MFLARQRFIEKEELQELLDDGWDVRDIMAEYGVARQSVYNAIKAYGLERYIEDRMSSRDMFDWEVTGQHAQDHHLKMLRYAIRQKRGVEFDADLAREIERWVEQREAEGVVVTYHPGRGFGFSPRQDGDEWLWRPGHYGRPVRRPPRKPASRRRADRDEE